MSKKRGCPNPQIPESINQNPSIPISNDTDEDCGEVEVIELNSFEFEGNLNTPKTFARTARPCHR